MLPGGGDVIARWKFLDDLDVRDQSGAREDSLEQVMTQKRVVGNAAAQRGFENIDVVDALAAVRTFAEQILVHVGNCKRIRVDAARAGEDALENRSSRPVGSDGVTRGCSTP